MDTTQESTDTPVDNFSTASAFTFHPQVEGGYTVDNGGPTNYGITQKTADAYNQSKGYPSMNVKDMTQDDAKHIARDQYWDGPGLESLPTRTATAVFDYGYNSGPGQAIKDLQRTVGVNDDGKMGPNTQKAISQYIDQNGEDKLLNDYIGRRQKLMSNLIMNNPVKYGPNALGWAHRISNLKGYLNVKDESDSQ